MEGKSTSAQVAASAHRTAPWLLAAGGTALLLVLALWWWWPRESGPGLGSAPPAAAASAPQPALAPIPAATGGAMIVDESTGQVSMAVPPATASIDLTTGPATVAASPATAATSATATGARERSTAVRPAPRPGSKEEENLLGTLLGIIQQPQNKPAKPESMDTLIARIRADESRSAAANQAAFDSIGAFASTDSGIQAQLRRCPAANTARGIECRRKICDKMAGKDPACPAR